MGKEYKTMTNREKFAEQILDIACSNDAIAVDKATLEPIACGKSECKDCLFNGSDVMSCGNKRIKWAISEYVEPPVDWSKVAVDTPILVRDNIFPSGVKDILQNMRMEAFMLGLTEEHRGVTVSMQHHGN